MESQKPWSVPDLEARMEPRVVTTGAALGAIVTGVDCARLDDRCVAILREALARDPRRVQLGLRFQF